MLSSALPLLYLRRTIPLRWLIAPKKEKHVGDNGDNGDGAEEEPKLSPAEKASTKIRDTKLSILKVSTTCVSGVSQHMLMNVTFTLTDTLQFNFLKGCKR